MPLTKNHYISEFYFKPWLDERKHLYRFSRQRNGLVMDKKTAGQICYEINLHTLTGAIKPEKKHFVEEWLTKSIDTKAAPIIAQVLEQGLSSITPDQAKSLINFVIALLVRRPENVKLLITDAPTTFREELSIIDEEDTHREAYKILSEMDLSLAEWTEKYAPGVIENIGQLMIGSIISDQTFFEKFARLTWWTVDFRGTSIGSLVASDRGAIALGKGVDDEAAIYVLPLSPHVALFGAQRKVQEKLMTVGKGQLGLRTLQSVIQSSRRSVFGRPDSNLNLIEKLLPACIH